MRLERIASLCLMGFALLAFTSGCSISNSISASSDSSSSISRSSDSSSGAEDSEEVRQAFVDDVATFTQAIHDTGITSGDFMSGISKIARKHGVTDWETKDMTYEAIGKGLKDAGVSKEKVASLPFLKVLLAGNERRLDLILEAY